MASNRPPNRLASETSPYLLQHARNPVDWRPWGDEAFEAARREDKPVFLSIGYSSCHWCHVMARESFEDEETARLLNETFVPVKVDREERPDVDRYYMAVCQALTGSGGWPLTLVLTPDRRPFFAATYLPKESRFGRGGLKDLVATVRRLWAGRRAEVLASAARVAEGTGRAFTAPAPETGDASAPPGRELLDRAYDWYRGDFDPELGGFGGAPKFPAPGALLFLLRYWKRTGKADARSMVLRTLDAMRRGGIHDHLGGGFHRYSTDARWLVPHFEKMLPDQALLAIAYLEAFQAAGRPADLDTARATLGYVLRDLAAPDGGFFAAEDAESEGREGRFYLWTVDELEAALPPGDRAPAAAAFGVTAAGNFRDPHVPVPGENVLRLARTPEEAGRELGKTPAEAKAWLDSVRDRLFRAREARPRPGRDTKILTDWNGLALAALARGAAVTGERRWLEAAGRTADFLLRAAAGPDGSVRHVAGGTGRPGPGFLDDQAFLAWGLLELFEVSGDPRDLEAALRLTSRTLEMFHVEEGALLAFAPSSGEVPELPAEVQDASVPSGNSVVFRNLLKLSRLTGVARWEEAAARLAAAMGCRIERFPHAAAFFLCGLDLAIGPSQEVVIAATEDAAATRALVDAVRAGYRPAVSLLVKPPGAGESAARLAALAPFVGAMGPVDGKPAAYVCVGGACRTPVTEADEIPRLGL